LPPVLVGKLIADAVIPLVAPDPQLRRGDDFPAALEAFQVSDRGAFLVVLQEAPEAVRRSRQG
jgi:hypothetical protein